MKTIKISYNPYKMITQMVIDGIDVCQNNTYDKFKMFIENQIPLQTWIEPIPYLDWGGFVNEVSDPEINDEVKILFSGRVIDFGDLKRAIADQNEERKENTRVIYHYVHEKVLDDKILSQNIDKVVKELKSDRFRKLVEGRSSKELQKRYQELDENYTAAIDNEFYIVFAGVYSSGKSTLLNVLIRHDILPTSSRTCTCKNCRIRHDKSLGKNVSLTGYDDNGKVVVKKRIFENDEDCAQEFLKLSPLKKDSATDEYSNVITLELGTDLSHLYPDSVSDDKFTIVLIDTPGMDSAKSIENGTNKHAEIALDAISMENKPMIILCSDANYSDSESIGVLLREIVMQSKEESSGFNDRFLFLMNKCDSIKDKGNYNILDVKTDYAEYLTDSSKWNINGNEEELKQLAENASHFVPRVFMTSSLIASAIQNGAYDFDDDELDDPYKDDLKTELDRFIRRIHNSKIQANFCLSQNCDIPNYRKDEIENAFTMALEEEDKVQAAQLQCGIIPVEYAIRDYIERYAYPIKVRRLLGTFEDILGDVANFTSGVLTDFKQAEEKLGEKNSEREEESNKKQCVEEKVAALEDAKKAINIQLGHLDEIHFDKESLKQAITGFQVEIENDSIIDYMRHHKNVITGQMSHEAVENEINKIATHIKCIFKLTLDSTNKKLEEIKDKHDRQIEQIFNILKIEVKELEKAGVFEQGGYSFTNSVLWKLNFSNIKSDNFSKTMMNTIVDKTIKVNKVRNNKKEEWSSSWNPYKKIRAWLMKDYEVQIKHIDGYYGAEQIVQSIDEYYYELQTETDEMEKMFTDVVEKSKEKVRQLTYRLMAELDGFLADIEHQENLIRGINKDIDKLQNEILRCEDTRNWLEKLETDIKGA